MFSECREPLVCSWDRKEDVIPSYSRTQLQDCPKPLHPMERQTPAQCPSFEAPESFQHTHPCCHAAALGPAGASLKEDWGDRWHWDWGSALPWTLAPSSGDPQIHPFNPKSQPWLSRAINACRLCGDTVTPFSCRTHVEAQPEV